MASKDDGEECMPCRGTGKVISNLGGAPSTVTCPWCKGGGARISGVDAQASWLGAEAEGGGDAEGGGSASGGDESPPAPPPDAAA